MLKYSVIFIVLILYYLITFINSFVNITNAVVRNDNFYLSKYIYKDDLQKNFEKDFDKFSKKIIITNKKFNFNEDNIQFSGEFSTKFLKKIFKKISKNLSIDLSDPKILLFFYYNSEMLSEYLNISISNLGNYKFDKLNFEKNVNTENLVEGIKKNGSNEIKKKINLKNLLKNIIKRISSVEYFFLTSPIHFTMITKHQNIKFKVIFKFNGLDWKIQKIYLPYEEILNYNL